MAPRCGKCVNHEAIRPAQPHGDWPIALHWVNSQLSTHIENGGVVMGGPKASSLEATKLLLPKNE